MRQRLISFRPGIDLPKIDAAFRVTPVAATVEGKSWYSIKALSKDETEVHIYDEIGFWGVTAADFLKDLAEVNTPKIALRINSPGGDVFDGIAIYNAIRRHEAEVSVWVDGLAASAASFIAMAGDSVTMSPHAQMMIHDAWGFAMGPADEMRKAADMLDKVSNNIASIYAEKAGGTTDEWRKRMLAEMWLSDQEAVDLGLADRIEESEEAAAARVTADELNTELRERMDAIQSSIQAEEEPESAPEAPDFNKLFTDIVEDEEYALA